MQIIFVNRFFFPDQSATSQMLSDLAFALARRGHSITVITSQSYYDPAQTMPLASKECIDGVQIHRIRTSRFGRSRLVGRSLDYVTFYVAASWALWRSTTRGSIVVAKTDPPMLSIVAAPIARARKAKLINWLQDIFPEIATTLGIGRKGIGAAAFVAIGALRTLSLKWAHQNIVIGERMSERVKALGVPETAISLMPNWADGQLVRPIAPEANSLREAWSLHDKFVVGYSGNLGRAHELETILAAIIQLESEAPIVRWLFIGGGAYLDDLKREIESRGIKTVQFQPYQPRALLSQSLSVADAHLVSLRPELEGLIVPSKLYGILAAGRPTIFIGDPDGEVARIIDQADCGINVRLGDGEGLAAAVQAFADNKKLVMQQGAQARRLLDAKYDLPHAVSRFEQILRRVTVVP